MDIVNFLGESSLAIVTVLWVIGVFLKEVPFVKDWSIPFLLMIAGVGLGIWMYGVTFDGVVQGILCVGGAVLCDQSIKQFKRRNEEKP